MTTSRYTITSVEGNRQRLDGGAMFGSVPRPMWQKWIAPDDQHRIPLACRAFLIHDQQTNRRILLDAGIGVFFEPKLKDRFGVEESDHRLIANLAALGITPDQIDIVILSHLHFDHAGGLLTTWQADTAPTLIFTNAKFIVGRTAWQRANSPHPRDRASFIPALQGLLQDSGRLQLIDDRLDDIALNGSIGPDFSVTISNGHTPGLLLTQLKTENGSAVFCADLIPGTPWVHLPITMGYDRFPELIVEEKAPFLKQAVQNHTLLLYTHDPNYAASHVTYDDTHKRYSAIDPQKALTVTL